MGRGVGVASFEGISIVGQRSCNRKGIERTPAEEGGETSRRILTFTWRTLPRKEHSIGLAEEALKHGQLNRRLQGVRILGNSVPREAEKDQE